MNLSEFNDLDFNNIGNWPAVAKVVLILFLCALLGGGLYYYVISSSFDALAQERTKEGALKARFEEQAKLAASLPAYKEQMEELVRRVDTQLKQLPNTNEVAGLLDDISFMATDSGLQLNRINWEPEVVHEFSTELPMRIEVAGSYNQIGHFAAGMAALPRIVILESFTLNGSKNKGDDEIAMTMLAKTYRYNGKLVEKKP